MKYRKSAIALCVGASILAANAIAETKTDQKVAFAAQKSVSQYIIQLDQAPALANSSLNQSNYRTEVSQVAAQQQAVFENILIIDPQAKLLSHARLFANHISVSVNPDYVNDIKALNGVKGLIATQSTKRYSDNSNFKLTTHADETEQTSETLVYMAPLMGDNEAGKGASVAILSTGIDYTLPMFAGSGVYGDDNDPETPPVAGSYLDALENGAVNPITPAVADDPNTPDIDESSLEIVNFAGFPTDVIVGGWDFNSENYGSDGNPIDQNLELSLGVDVGYPTGLGTKLASIVHQLAPGADLYAYKITNISADSRGNLRVRGASRESIIQALEHAADPNQDGDTSDHVDVVLMDAGGAAAFYHKYEQSGSPFYIQQQMIERASAMGMTIVTHAGYGGHREMGGGESKTNIRHFTSVEGASPSAITVGSAIYADDHSTIVPAKWSPKGPVRGSKDLKPELMAQANATVSLISNPDETAATIDTMEAANVASARIAAAVAVVKAKHSNLGPIELKALLSNTADHQISEVDYETGEVLEQAELIHIGHGIPNLEAALSSAVVVWNSDNMQPFINFGVVEVHGSKTMIKKLMVKNLTAQEQVYSANFIANGNKEAQQAIRFDLPSSISVAANSSVEIDVKVSIDGSMLPEWPLVSSADYTDENWKKTELNGYIQLSADDQPTINFGWMIQPRSGSTISISGVAVELPASLGWNSDLGRSEWINFEWARNFYPEKFDEQPNYFSLMTTLVNESDTPTTYETYPVVINTESEPKGKERTYGHKIKTVGAGLYNDASCEMGKKFTVAVNLYQPADIALANHFDKMGTPLFYYELLTEQQVIDNGWNESFAGHYLSDSELVAQPWVEIDGNGQPATYYIDLGMEYDRNDPDARIKKSKLPARITPDGKNVVSEVCIEELAHHDYSDAVDDPTLPVMVAELDENGNPIAEMVTCEGYTLEQMIDFGYFEDYGQYYCSSSTGLWDPEGFALDADGNHIISMVENTERGVPGINELLDFYNQNLGFRIETDRDAKAEKYQPVAQFNPTNLGYYKSETVCFWNSWMMQEMCEVVTNDLGTKSGFAHLTDGATLQTADYSHTITVAPGEEFALAAVGNGLHGGVHIDFMVISSNDNYSKVGALNWNDGDGEVMAEVKAGQEFDVTENPEMGTVIGKIELDTKAFFAVTETRYYDFGLTIMNAIPGTPFAINSDQEIYVINPEAIDFENMKSFEVMVAGSQSAKDDGFIVATSITVSIPVMVNVINKNDIAPVVVNQPADVMTEITNSSDAVVSIDISDVFSELEGDSLTVIVNGLPAGLTYKNGVISGETDVAGSFVIEITATDGINETSTSFNLTIEDNTSSSGSFGGLMLAMFGLTLFRRRN